MFNKYPKKFKIILYLPLTLFFLTNLLYFPLPAKAAPNDSMPYLQVSIPELKFTPFDKIMSECKEENGQKICSFPWIGEYIAGIYKYAIGIVGILAAVVLMIGGVLWIMAGGSATAIGEAKSWIGASLTGLVIALTSYLILYQINPALTVFQPLKIAQVKPTLTKADYGESAVCSSRYSYRIGDIVNYHIITERKSLPSACADYNFNGYDTSANILRALAATESSCIPQKESPDHACGLMQLVPATAKIYDARADCQWLKDNPQESIKIASKYISDHDHAAAHRNRPARIFAGYNSNYSTLPNPRTGKLGALAPSSNCPGYLAFECCINPGELAETQNHVFNSIMYLNGM